MTPEQIAKELAQMEARCREMEEWHEPTIHNPLFPRFHYRTSDRLRGRGVQADAAGTGRCAS